MTLTVLPAYVHDDPVNKQDKISRQMTELTVLYFYVHNRPLYLYSGAVSCCFSLLGPISITAVRCVAWRCVASDSLSLATQRHATQRAAVMKIGPYCCFTISFNLPSYAHQTDFTKLFAVTEV